MVNVRYEILKYYGFTAGPKIPHVVDGVLDFQSLRLAYCEQATLLKAGQTDPSMKPVLLDFIYTFCRS